MVRACRVVASSCLLLAGWVPMWVRAGEPQAAEVPSSAMEETAGWPRIDSRYCTIWVDPSLEVRKINQKLKTWMLRPQVAAPKSDTPEGQLAAKCDTIFRKAQELLDMYPPGVHVTLRVSPKQNAIQSVHAARYGVGTEAIAIYVFENNTIYATAKDLSTSVLAHEMAHCIIDHYFGVRPPRKVEEMLAMYVDAHLEE